MWKRLVCSSNHNNPRPFPTTRFSVLARERRFEELADLLAISLVGNNNNNNKNKPFKYPFDVPLPLHYLLQYQPPLCLVNMVLKYTKAEYTDAQGRNALHVACYYNCNVAILARLINYEKCNLNHPDIIQRRYPLHYLCDEYDKSLATSAMFLRDVLPEATLHKDIHGMTPADILHHQSQRRSGGGTTTRLDEGSPNHGSLLQLNNALPYDEAADAFASTTETTTTTRMLHIPIEMKETVSDLTNATAFLLLNNNPTTTSSPTTNASFHSKSTCTTAMVVEDPVITEEDDDEEEEEQQIIIQEVRKQLLTLKQQVPPPPPSTTIQKKTMNSNTKNHNKSNRFFHSQKKSKQMKQSTRGVIPAPVFRLPTVACNTTNNNNTDWESVRC